MIVNELDSIETQLPYDYFSLKYCPVPEERKEIHKGESIGSLLLGEKTEYSGYSVSMFLKQKFFLGLNETYRTQCSVNLTKEGKERFIWMIERNYRVNMYNIGLNDKDNRQFTSFGSI